MKPKLIIDDAIPFLEGRLETYFDCRFMPGEEITKSDLRDAEGLLVRTAHAAMNPCSRGLR